MYKVPGWLVSTIPTNSEGGSGVRLRFVDNVAILRRWPFSDLNIKADPDSNCRNHNPTGNTYQDGLGEGIEASPYR